MNLKLTIKMCVAAIGIFLLLQANAARAEIVIADQVVPQSQAEADRLKIQNLVERAEVKDKLQVLGVEESISNVRVAAMTDAEIHAIAQTIDTMPAGGRLTNSDLILILLLILLILLI